MIFRVVGLVEFLFQQPCERKVSRAMCRSSQNPLSPVALSGCVRAHFRLVGHFERVILTEYLQPMF